MNRNRILPIAGALFLALIALGTSSCTKDNCTTIRTVPYWEPVYQFPDEFRQPISPEGPRTLQQPGKIYVFGDVLFVGERQEGIHLIDNRDPAAPVKLAFLPIKGNTDMAVKDGILYANNHMDLVAIDIASPLEPKYIGRTNDVFPGYHFEEARGYIVDYVEMEREEEVPCNTPENIGCWNCPWGIGIAANDMATFSESQSISAAGSGAGVGGSMARFTIAGEHLYVVDDHSLRIFDLNEPASPLSAGVFQIGWGIETIFPYENQLFIGSQTGMYIYDRTDPLQPEQLSVFEHANACDPVFVDGDLAYVTLRDGTNCQTFTNQLEVVDISNLRDPQLLITYPMHRPHGLSVANDHLFLCDDDEGLKVFDASRWDKIGERLRLQLDHFNAYDVITLPRQNLALVVGDDGLYQFDFSDPANLQPLSIIAIEK